MADPEMSKKSSGDRKGKEKTKSMGTEAMSQVMIRMWLAGKLGVGNTLSTPTWEKGQPPAVCHRQWLENTTQARWTAPESSICAQLEIQHY